MKNATRVTVSTFGAIAGLAGIEHSIGEVLQGNVAPEGIMILSWPDSEVFAILAGTGGGRGTYLYRADRDSRKRTGR